jgi:hypothetical protein
VEVIPDSPAPRDSFVQVKTNGGFVWVMGIAGGNFVAVQTHQCDDGLFFVGPPGQYVIYGVEQLDDKQVQFQRFLSIVDGNPQPPVPPPVPPNPDPPEPTPTPPPLPDGTENLYGIAEPAYRLALQAGTAADVGRLAEQYSRAATFLHEMRMTPELAMQQLQAVRNSLSGDWTQWEIGVEAAVDRAIKKYGGGQLAWRDYCREIAGALRAAERARKPAVKKTVAKPVPVQAGRQ